MNTKESIEKAIREFGAMSPSRNERPWWQSPECLDALAAHLAKVLPPTVDELWQAVAQLDKPSYEYLWFEVSRDGSGAVHGGDDRGSVLLEWGDSDNPGKTAIETIKAHTKPEPTAKEKALSALSMLDEAVENIRQALERSEI